MSGPGLDHDEETSPRTAAETAPPEVQALTPGLLRRSLAKIREATRETVAPWEGQLAKLPRGRAATLARLKKASEDLAQSVADGDSAVLQASISHLAVPLEAMGKHRSAPSSSEEENLLSAHGPEVNRMHDEIASAARGLRQLADLAVRGAADLDPHSVSRILERKRDLGDATLRRIEDKIATTRSRKDKKRLQEMRDDMRNWLANRDARLESVQPVVDELALRTDVLRKTCMLQSKRLARAADLTGCAAVSGKVMREGMEFSACLRAMLLATHVDANAPLEQN